MDKEHKSSRWKNRKMNRQSASSRIFALLLDGGEHKLEEMYDWIIESIPSNKAIRRVSIPEEEDLFSSVNRGKRKVLLGIINMMKRNNFIAVVSKPVRERKGRGKYLEQYDITQCVFRLTDEGSQHISSISGVFTSIMGELYLGFVSGKIKIQTQFMGRPDFEDEDQKDQPELVLTGNEQLQS